MKTDNLLKNAANDIALAIKSKWLGKDVKKKLATIESNEVDFDKLKLTDIAELDTLQKLQDSFSTAFDIPSVIYDIEGERITKPSGCTEFCALVHSTEKGLADCEKFHKTLMLEMAENKSMKLKKGCTINNIVTGAAPIIIQDQHLANWRIGQLVDGELDLDEIKNYARKIGLNEKKLIEAAGKLKRIDDASIKKIVTFLNVLSEQISVLATRNFMLGHDINEHKRIEDEKDKIENQLRYSQKMEAVGNLAGGIAHDFNNIIQVILTYTEFVLAKTPDENETRQDMEQIYNAANRAGDLTSQLLAFSSRQVIEPVDVSIIDIINDLMKMVQRLIGENINLTFEHEDYPMSVHVDCGQIERVFINLFFNARDAMPNGGEITITAKLIDVNSGNIENYSLDKLGQYVLIAVKDTGCGMNKQVQKHIFDPFFTTKEVGKGTGMGLSTAYGIISQHNGKINIDSEIGKGTTFNIFLPEIENKQVVHKNSESNQNLGGPETILIAEDDVTLLKLTERTLVEAGYNVLCAIDGQDALNIFLQKSDEIDMAVFDVVMPRLGGIDAMKIILKKRPELPYLFVSGYSNDAAHSSFVQELGSTLLRKPFTRDALLKKIKEALVK